MIVTDIYIENLGGGVSALEIMEQRGPNSFELRYQFRTHSDQTKTINFTTGIRLGEEVPLTGAVRIQNSTGSKADVLARVNGIFVP